MNVCFEMIDFHIKIKSNDMYDINDTEIMTSCERNMNVHEAINKYDIQYKQCQPESLINGHFIWDSGFQILKFICNVLP